MNFTRLAAGSLFVFSVFAGSVATAQEKLPDDVLAVAKGGNEFATDLYARLRSDKPSNLFFSTYSFSTARACSKAGILWFQSHVEPLLYTTASATWSR